MKLLRRFLAPYAGSLAIVVALQLVATVASLFLPSENAKLTPSPNFIPIMAILLTR